MAKELKLTPEQAVAVSKGAELVIVLGKAYVRGIDQWPTLMRERG